jgi:hypothetical protein
LLSEKQPKVPPIPQPAVDSDTTLERDTSADAIRGTATVIEKTIGRTIANLSSMRNKPQDKKFPQF